MSPQYTGAIWPVGADAVVMTYVSQAVLGLCLSQHTSGVVPVPMLHHIRHHTGTSCCQAHGQQIKRASHLDSLLAASPTQPCAWQGNVGMLHRSF